MARVRVEKVQELIKQEVSNIILNDIKDPRVKFATVTAVEVTNDLRHAKLYISLFGNDEEKEKSWQGLQKALGFIRSELGKRMSLRFIPELSLHLDKSLEYSEHIQELLTKFQK